MLRETPAHLRNLPTLTPQKYEQVERGITYYRKHLSPAGEAKVIELFLEACTVWPNTKMTVEEKAKQMKAYERNLKDIPADILAVAFDECVQTCKFFPTVAEIREKAAKPLSLRQSTYHLLRELSTHRKPKEEEDKPLTAEQQAELEAIRKRLGLKKEGE